MSVVSARHPNTEGFAWPKLIAGTLIVGLLTAIALPLYLDQVKKGHDAEAESNLNTVASGIVAAVGEDQAEAPVLAVSGTSVTLEGETIATLSPGVVLGSLQWVNADDWCIDATDPDGKHAASPGYKYKASDEKTKTGQCS